MHPITRTPCNFAGSFYIAITLFTACIESVLAEGHIHVIDAMTDNAGNYIWRPASIPYSEINVGDEIVWKNASIENPGFHAVSISNWTAVKSLFEILTPTDQFNQETGTNKPYASSDSGAIFLRARIKQLPPKGQSVNYQCWVHGIAQSGTLFGTSQSPNLPSPPTSNSDIHPPTALIAAFEPLKVTDLPVDSYYAIAADVNGDGMTDIATSGLGIPGKELSDVAWYENPSWKKHIIGKFDVPVAMESSDIDNDGHIDIAIAYNYGNCIMNCRQENGTIAWYKNPGHYDQDEAWESYHIGELMASHRLRFGHFSNLDQLQLISVPVVGGIDGNIHDPIKTKVFTKPENLKTAKEWPSVIANDMLRVIHEITTGKFREVDGSRLDSMLTASEEGITWVYYSDRSVWESKSIGYGAETPVGPEKWKGSGAVAVAKIPGDDFAFIASSDPFHGNILSVYTKDKYTEHTANSLSKATWKRSVIDSFGPLTNRGEGPSHDIQAVDIDRDGTDELLVGLRGPMPYSGVYVYKVIDLARGMFARQRVSSYSAAKVIVADFDNDKKPDFAIIPYRVVDYYQSPDTEVMIYLNQTPLKFTH